MSSGSEIQRILAGVERENGTPVVVSKWGFRTVEIDGKKYLHPNTKDEAIVAAKAALGDKFHESMLGGCYTGTAAVCHSQGCNGRCTPVDEGGVYVCICEN
jgi:hypothetical protein